MVRGAAPSATSQTPSTTRHELLRHADVSDPLNKTMASAGAGSGGCDGPGFTRRGAGRSGSCTTHSHHGSLGVALWPNTPEPSLAWTIDGSAAGRCAFHPT